MVGDDRALFGKAGGVLLFASQERQRNEHREVRIDVAGGLEAVVELALHLFPDGVAVRANDHAATHGAVLGQLRVADDVQVPLTVVLRARRNALGIGLGSGGGTRGSGGFVLLGHKSSGAVRGLGINENRLREVLPHLAAHYQESR